MTETKTLEASTLERQTDRIFRAETFAGLGFSQQQRDFVFENLRC
jgi:hypothetical protein